MMMMTMMMLDVCQPREAVPTWRDERGTCNPHHLSATVK